MCGPSNQMLNAQADQSSLAKSMSANYATQFGKQSAVMDQINRSLAPTLAAGPNQHGFSAEELAAKNTAAINSTGANYANAARANNNRLAGRGGDSGLMSGIDAQIAGSETAAGAAQLSGEQNQITQQDWATGRANYSQALAGESNNASLYNPTAYGGEASNANKSNFDMANTNNIASNQLAADIGGAAMGAIKMGAGFATGGLSNLDTKGTSNFGEQLGNFASGGFNALSGRG